MNNKIWILLSLLMLLSWSVHAEIKQIIYDSPNSIIYEKDGHFNKVIYINPINRLIGGKYVPIEDTFSLTQVGENLLIKDILGEECQIIPSYNLKTKTDIAKTSFNISKKQGSWYFISNVDKEVNSLSWEVKCSKEVSYDTLKDDLILPNDLKIDFSQAKLEQGITTIFNKTSNKLEFTSMDKTELTKLDPTVTYNESSSSVTIICNTTNPNTAPISGLGTGTDVTVNAAFNANDANYYIFSTELNQYGWCKLSVNLSDIPTQGITQATFFTDTDSSSATLNLFHYIYNYTSSLWNNLTNWSQSTSDISTASTITSNFSDYKNSTNGLINFLIQTNTSSTSDAKLDFIFMNVTYDDGIVNAPIDNQEILNSLSTTLNTSQTKYNSTVFYTLNNGKINYTLCTNSNECSNTITFPRQGFYNLSVFFNASDGTIISKTVQNLFVGNRTYLNISNANVKDTYLDPVASCAGTGLCQYGTDITLQTGLASNRNNRVLLYFNITSLAGYTLANATFYLWVNEITGTASKLYFQRIISNWVEDDANAVYNSTTTNWNNYAGDYSGIYEHNSSETFYTSSTHPAWYSFSLTNLFNQFVNNTYPNYGFMFNSSNQALNLEAYSSEAATATPYMLINYYTPTTSISPTITLTTANYTNYTSTGIVNLTFNISDDNDYLKNISVYLDGALTSTITNPTINVSINNTFNFTLGVKSAGNYTWYIQVYDSDLNSTTSETRMFHVNTVPAISAININSSTPTDLEDLLCNISTPTDADGNSVSVTYEWYNFTGGAYVAQSINNSVLINTNTTTGDQWYCSATPFDGIENGTMRTSSVVSINTGFAPPVIINTNATTNATNIISNANNPTWNNSWVNLTVQFTDANAGDAWTAHFCSSTLYTLSGCTDTTYCISEINSTSNVLSCNFTALNFTSTLYDYYVVVADNTSLYTSTTSGTFHVNHPPNTPTILSPTANTSLNYSLVNFTAIDSDLDTLNFTVYNSTDATTWSQLAIINSSGYNWTNLKDGTYYLKARPYDIHGYQGYYNSSNYAFSIDTTPPVLSAITVSATSMYTTDTLTLYANSTDATTSSSNCLFTVIDTTGTATNYSATKSGNTFTKTVTSATVGTLQFNAIFCNDSVGNMVSNTSININITVTVYSSGGTTPGGGGGATPQECSFTSECITKFGDSYICKSNKCVINPELLTAEGTFCNYDGICEFDRGESWVNCKCDPVIGCGKQVEKSGDCFITLETTISLFQSKILLYLTGLAVLLIFIFFIFPNMNIRKKYFIKKQTKVE